MTPETEVYLYKGVPFSNNYIDVLKFNNVAEQNSYFASLERLKIEKMSYQRTNNSIRVPFEKDKILNYNYLSFKNKNYTDKVFYGFITNITYINPNCSEIVFEIDVFQTWQFQINYRKCYINREHQNRWNADGSPVINTIPENLDIGNEYQYVGESSNLKENLQEVQWLCLVTSLDETDYYSEKIAGVSVTGGVPQYLQCFYYPIRINNPRASASLNEDYSRGEPLYENVFLEDLMNNFRNGSNLVNKLKSIYMIDYPPFNYGIDSQNTSSSHTAIVSNAITPYKIYKDVDSNGNKSGEVIVYGLNKDYTGSYGYFNCTYQKPWERIKALTGVTESKLLMYPYSYFKVSDNRGNEKIFKNEYTGFNSDNKLEIDIRSCYGNTPKVIYNLSNYLGITEQDMLDHSLINNEPNGLTIVDDYSAAYLQGNANTMRQTIENTINQGRLTNQLVKNTGVGNIIGSFMGNMGNVVSGAGNIYSGTQAGVIAGSSAIASASGNIVGGLIGQDINEINTMAQTSLNNRMAIENDLAKRQDISNVADNVSLQGGNTFFNFLDRGRLRLFVRLYQITPEYKAVLTDYFRKYGYAIHKIKMPNIHTRKSWNYVQVTECNFTGDMPEIYMNKIKDIFNTGVTIWHTKDVGNYDLNNDEI